MDRMCCVVVAFTANLCMGSAAQEVENAGFTQGKTGWQGDGKVVYLVADGTVSETEKEGATPALRIQLKKSGWSEVRQVLRPKAKDSAVSFGIQVKADADFKRLPESRDYSPVKFTEGGKWVWSAKVNPKCDFLVRLEDKGWYYRPHSLSPGGSWKTVAEEFPELVDRKRELALLFPPGEGTVYLQAVK